MKNDLDHTVRAWADRRVPAAGQLRAEIARASREPAGSAEPEPPRAWRPALAFATAAAAAGIALLATLHHPAPAAVPALLSVTDVRGKWALHEELTRLFGDAYRSAVITPGGMDLDVAAAGEEGPRPGLLVRLVVQRRAAGAAEWSPVWQADVLGGEQDPIRIDAAQGGALALWLLRTPDGRFVVDGSGRLASVPDEHLAILDVVKPCTPAELQSFGRNGERFRIVGEVCPLEERA